MFGNVGTVHRCFDPGPAEVETLRDSAELPRVFVEPPSDGYFAIVEGWRFNISTAKPPPGLVRTGPMKGLYQIKRWVFPHRDGEATSTAAGSRRRPQELFRAVREAVACT